MNEIEKGKKLSPVDVELRAIKKYGRKEYRKELKKALGGSTALYTYAFSGRAPKKLFEIDQHLKTS